MIKLETREDIVKKAGKMIIVYHHSQAGDKCFAIGWFYALEVDLLKLKVTSTRFETYDSIEIDFNLVDRIEDYQHNN